MCCLQAALILILINISYGTLFFLLWFSVIMLDEAHERTLYTDIAIGLLKKVGPLYLYFPYLLLYSN